MPKNGKHIRLAQAGEEIRADLLARLQVKGINTLFVEENSSKEDPASCNLYQDEAEPSNTSAPAPSPDISIDFGGHQSPGTVVPPAMQPNIEALPPATPGSDLPALERDTNLSLGSVLPAPPKDEQDQGTPIAALQKNPDRYESDQNSDSLGASVFDTADAVSAIDSSGNTPAESSRTIAPESDPPIGELSAGSSPLEEAESQRLASRSEEADFQSLNSSDSDASHQISPSPGAAEEIQRFSEGASGPEAERKFKGSAAIESLTRIAGKAAQNDLNARRISGALESENANVVSGLVEALEEVIKIARSPNSGGASEKIQGICAELESCVSALSNGNGETLEEIVISADKALEEATRIFGAELPDKADETIHTISGVSPEQNAAAKVTLSAAVNALEKARSFTGTSTEKFEQRFKAEKIATEDRTEMLRTKSDSDSGKEPVVRRDRIEHISVDNSEIYRSSNANTSEKEQGESRFHQSRDPGEVVTLKGGTDSSTNTFELSEGGKAANFKELPATAGRMAALLAHSLGYVNQAYLSDLALATMAFFLRKEGKQLNSAALPSLARIALEEQSITVACENAVSDCLEIIHFLEAYFEVPDCDRTLRELSKRTLQQTFSDTRGRSTAPNIWNEARWSQMVDKGPTIEAQSTCGRAAAKAIKLTKQLSI